MCFIQVSICSPTSPTSVVLSKRPYANLSVKLEQSWNARRICADRIVVISEKQDAKFQRVTYLAPSWAHFYEVWDHIDYVVDPRDMWSTPVARYCNDLINILVVDVCDTLTESLDVIDLERPMVETHIRNLDLISATYYTRQVVTLYSCHGLSCRAAKLVPGMSHQGLRQFDDHQENPIARGGPPGLMTSCSSSRFQGHDVSFVRETHQIAEAQQEKNAKLREAFGISEYFVEGSSLDPQRHVKEAQAKAAAEQNKNYMLVRTPSPTPAHTEQAADKSNKRKRRIKDSSSSPEAKREKKKKSKKHKKDRSESPKHSKKKSSSSKDKKKEKDRHKRQRSSSSSLQTVSSSDDSDSSKSNTDAKPKALIGQESAPKPPPPLKDYTCKKQVHLPASGVSVSGDGRKHHKKRDKNKRASTPLKEPEKTDKRSRAEVNLVEGAGQ
uniref:Uncharacterized protein n=1 Tax=Timema shepardi TaxID=629360 RepID=A0A7R9ARV0_TIMSH|nr:unnamed protein product [Timema shepardi]